MSASVRRLSSILLLVPGLASAQFVEAVRALRAPVPAIVPADLGVREYTLKGYPKGTEPCVASAVRIGEAVARAAGVKVVRAYCSAEDANGYEIKVVYEAAEALRPVTTVNRAGRGEGFGAFDTRQECEAALAAEAAAFEAATGLAPVVSYCLRDDLSDKGSWSMRIDSFGAARLAPMTKTLPVFTRPDGVGRSEFLGGIKDRLQAQGVDARFVAWRPVSGYAELSIAYYAAQRLAFELSEPAKLDSKAQCQAALAEMQPVLAARTPAPLALYCGQQMIGGWEVAWMYMGAPSIKTVMAAESFKSYADCMAARVRVAEHHRSDLGQHVVGSVCSREVLEYAWKVILLEE
ncbi:MAG: hypothetical protein HY928_09760 [Elusimicrobia bacterium]|nr:hypothetical protein [Elusimicrobiota bacterium]